MVAQFLGSSVVWKITRLRKRKENFFIFRDDFTVVSDDLGCDLRDLNAEGPSRVCQREVGPLRLKKIEGTN
ncbi:hypothetical protein TP2_12760 [Thioclava pacifica DSM 10166]|uniref:Uncharacterized protein n=1 Tax=Thioclava pacifica DSM 10166 TaxID=1353537 RepID=A0A074J432_9RHOB|nr:hypothetical protein TP2_12760 [Thioclava pacifica DSM 10166]